MKNIILIFLFTILIQSNLDAQWNMLKEGFRGRASNLDFVNDRVGWIIGDKSILYKTSDGGETWSNIVLNDSINLQSIDFISESIGWTTTVRGEQTFIIKTEDGGLNWMVQKIWQDTWLGCIYAVDETHVYTAGNAKIFKTLNGGSDWIDVSPGLDDAYYYSMYFLNPDTGVVAGDYRDSSTYKGVVFKTINGGTTWNKIIIDETTNVSSLQFLNFSAGYFIGQALGNNFIGKTVDLFDSWTAKPLLTNWIISYQFIDTLTAYAATFDSLFKVMKTTDGGNSWFDTQSFQYTLSEIYCLSRETGFLLGDFSNSGNSILLKCTDGGSTWEIKKFSYPYQDVYFLNNNQGMIGGVTDLLHLSQSRIFNTTDGGISWDIGDPFRTAFKSFYFLNEQTGFYLTTQAVYKSTNMGQDWNLIYENNFDSTKYYFSGSEICFRNEEIGWIVGYSQDSNYVWSSAILETNDNGIHWNLIWKETSAEYYGLQSVCYQGSIGWAVGEQGTILKYTAQTGWIKIPSVTDLPLNKVISVDDAVWISGGYSDGNNIFLRSTDSGQTWIKNETIPYQINDMYFFDKNGGWAVGGNADYYGVILKTTDGGDNWETIIGNLVCPLNSITIIDNYGWAVGYCGLVLRNTDAGITWIDNNNGTQPAKFMLEQNYPNPFNPNTKISWESPIAGMQTIKIYDILGREIKTLVNEYKLAGRYEIEFNAENLSSGIYFYRLKAGEHITTKKMVIVR